MCALHTHSYDHSNTLKTIQINKKYTIIKISNRCTHTHMQAHTHTHKATYILSRQKYACCDKLLSTNIC